MKKFMFVFAAVLAAILALSGCGIPGQEKQTDSGSLTIMTWNVHNLFDGKDDGTEYPEFRQAAGWSREKYLGRINTISAAIGSLDPQPDIILFQEIENFGILKDLTDTMPKRFHWGHFANNPDSAIGLGIISRFPIIEVKAHSIYINGDTIPRPVLETRILIDSKDLGGQIEIVIFNNHWKSKIGGVEVTEYVRRAAARVIVRRIQELQETEPQTGIIVAGDLNLNYDEFSRRDSSVIVSLLPDSPAGAELVNLTGEEHLQRSFQQKDFIVISGSRPPVPVYFPQRAVVLFSPWIQELENGSYFYRNNWETIDHFLVSHHFFNGTGWEYERTVVIDFEPFTRSNGQPNSYNPRTGNGLSDHLPLLLKLTTL